MPFFYVWRLGDIVRDHAKRLDKVVSSAVEALGYQLWGCELSSHGSRTILRVYIDKEKGISLDDCQKVSHQVSAVLDVEEPIKGSYTLEVSSPGLDRPIFTLEQCKQFVGKQIKVKLRVPVKGRRNFSGKLESIEGEDLILLIDDEKFVISFLKLERANLISEQS